MNCQTLVGPDKTVICGHSITQHDGDESGMGGPDPCMVCGCQNFTREVVVPPQRLTSGGPAHGGFTFTDTTSSSLLDPLLPLEEFIGQAVGAASMCWEKPEGAGVFDSERAQKIVEEIMSRISEALR